MANDDEYAFDELYEEAIRAVLRTRRGSVSMLQRTLRIGYSRAARLIVMMVEDGILGPYQGSQAREVLVDIGGRQPPFRPLPDRASHSARCTVRMLLLVLSEVLWWLASFILSS